MIIKLWLADTGELRPEGDGPVRAVIFTAAAHHGVTGKALAARGDRQVPGVGLTGQKEWPGAGGRAGIAEAALPAGEIHHRIAAGATAQKLILAGVNAEITAVTVGQKMGLMAAPGWADPGHGAVAAAGQQTATRSINHDIVFHKQRASRRETAK